LLSSDELYKYDHSACDVKDKIVIDFSYLNKMGVNKNISILMLLIVCGLKQVLILIESVIVKKVGAGGYVN
jgi:hypothetical protein